MLKAGWVALVITVAGLLGASRLPVARSRLNWDGTIYRTTGNAPACLTADRYRRFITYSRAKDDSPSAGMLEQGVCVWLRPGIEVQPVRRVGWWLDSHRLVQVRVISTRQTMVLDERRGLAIPRAAQPR